MKQNDIEKLLKESLADFKLDQVEKQVFRHLSEELREDQLSFIRNKAFEFSRPHIENGGVDAVRVLNWLSRIVKTIQPLKKSHVIASEAYFSPGDSCRNKIISLLKDAEKTIDICVFTISDNKITQAILDAHKRGIDVTIISDNDKANDKGSDIHYLQNKGLNIIVDKSSYHMHHKFSIFDKKILLSGSFNWTRSATDVNEENILVTGEPGLVSQFSNQFESLKNKLNKL